MSTKAHMIQIALVVISGTFDCSRVCQGAHPQGQYALEQSGPAWCHHQHLLLLARLQSGYTWEEPLRLQTQGENAVSRNKRWNPFWWSVQREEKHQSEYPPRKSHSVFGKLLSWYAHVAVARCRTAALSPLYT
jgi:hypothetical protein